ncbi:MAG: alpha-hydroxy-acid oxidizing protein, partial [Vicinamibacterales bacterium]
MKRAINIEDLRRAAQARLPRVVFDYIDGGAEDELTLAANRTAFTRTTFRPRVLRGIGKVDISSSLLGQPTSYPL